MELPAPIVRFLVGHLPPLSFSIALIAATCSLLVCLPFSSVQASLAHFGSWSHQGSCVSEAKTRVNFAGPEIAGEALAKLSEVQSGGMVPAPRPCDFFAITETSLVQSAP